MRTPTELDAAITASAPGDRTAVRTTTNRQQLLLRHPEQSLQRGNLDGLEDIDGIEITDPGLVEQPDGTYRYSADSKLRHNISTRPLRKAAVGPTWSWA